MPGVFFLLTLPMGWRQAKLGFRYVCVNTPGPVGPVVSEHTHARQVRLFFFFSIGLLFLGRPRPGDTVHMDIHRFHSMDLISPKI